MNLLAYERINAVQLSSSVRLFEGEMLLIRQPFRWLLNGEVINNCYEMFDVNAALYMRQLEIVDSYGEHIFIVKKSDTPVLENRIRNEPKSISHWGMH